MHNHAYSLTKTLPINILNLGVLLAFLIMYRVRLNQIHHVLTRLKPKFCENLQSFGCVQKTGHSQGKCTHIYLRPSLNNRENLNPFSAPTPETHTFETHPPLPPIEKIASQRPHPACAAPSPPPQDTQWAFATRNRAR